MKIAQMTKNIKKFKQIQSKFKTNHLFIDEVITLFVAIHWKKQKQKLQQKMLWNCEIFIAARWLSEQYSCHLDNMH